MISRFFLIFKKKPIGNLLFAELLKCSINGEEFFTYFILFKNVIILLQKIFLKKKENSEEEFLNDLNAYITNINSKVDLKLIYTHHFNIADHSIKYKFQDEELSIKLTLNPHAKLKNTTLFLSHFVSIQNSKKCYNKLKLIFEDL
jgi:hypothetical protein